MLQSVAPPVTPLNSRGDKLTRSASVCEPRPLVHISMTEYEQKVTRTLYWLTAASHRDALLSSSRGATRMDWWPEYTLKPETHMQAERLSGTTDKNKTKRFLLRAKGKFICSEMLVYLHRHQRAKPRPQ